MSKREKEAKTVLGMLRQNGVAEAYLNYRTLGAGKKKCVTNSRDSFETLMPFFSDIIDHHEEMYLMLLNRRNAINGVVKISQGGLAGTVCDIKIVAQAVVLSHSCSCILAHNHPSGNPKPSHEDRKLTERMHAALKVLDVKLLDHIILTDESYYSFADEGVI